MLKNILSFEELPKNLDSTDGLAAAVCHYFNKNHINKEANFLLGGLMLNKPQKNQLLF